MTAAYQRQDAKTSKSPKRTFFPFLFSPPLIFSFLNKNKNRNAKQNKNLQKFWPQSLYPDFRLTLCLGFTIVCFCSFKFNELMHRPLGRATLVVHAPFGLAWGLSLTASLARPLAWWLCKGFDSASSCLAHFGRRPKKF